MPFVNRSEAGRRLAARLGHLHGEDPVVVGLPRGGVSVAFEVARALDAPLDVIIVRKRGVPSQPELAVGAIGEDGVRVACQVARQHGAARVVLAVPVAPPGWSTRVGRDADELICLTTPETFLAGGQFYDGFSPTSDDEVAARLERADARSGTRPT